LRIESLTSSFESDIVQAERLRTAKIRDIRSQIDNGFDILTKNGSISDKDIDEFRKQAGDLIEMDDGTTFYEPRRDPYVLDFSKVIR
jgi:hypothetical protein